VSKAQSLVGRYWYERYSSKKMRSVLKAKDHTRSLPYVHVPDILTDMMASAHWCYRPSASFMQPVGSLVSALLLL
jgi:hypothetical protein